MAGSGSPQLEVDGSGLKVAVVAASWHEELMTGLIEGAQRALEEVKVTDVDLYRVPGSFELPVVVKKVAATHDAVVALGVIIKGGTPHFTYVSIGVTNGLTTVAVETGVPVGFGILTCDNEVQARDRSGTTGSHESKGYEAALAAVTTAVVLRDIG